MAFAGQGLFDDLDTDPMADATNVVAFPAGDIRKAAHIANGGEATFDCPKCNGTGRFGRYGRCFKCDGKGKVSKRVAAAAKATQTRAAAAENNSPLMLACRAVGIDPVNAPEKAIEIAARIRAQGPLSMPKPKGGA